MNKSKIYTLLGICLSFTVVLGGWFFTKAMLNRKEQQLLLMKGQLPMAEVISMPEEEFEPAAISEEVMAEILAAWEIGGREVLHEPMEQQMNMQQAIEAGRAWIDNMQAKEILSNAVTVKEFDNINAVLCTPYNQQWTQQGLDERLISYWTIIYSSVDAQIILTIHALSGQVWKADIITSENKILTESCTDEQLLMEAFPFLTAGYIDLSDSISVSEGYDMMTEGSDISESGQIEIHLDDGKLYGFYEQGYVCAVFKRYHIADIEGEQKTFDHMQLELQPAEGVF